MATSNHIDPAAITCWTRTGPQIEAFCLFALLVSGKDSFVIAPALNAMLDAFELVGETPFATIRRLSASGQLYASLQAFGLHGQHTRMLRALPALASFDLSDFRTASPEQLIERLEAVYGIGAKSSRFILLHNREGLTLAALDRHILRFLRAKGHKTPKGDKTPTAKGTYARLSAAFIAEAARLGQTPAALDFALWSEAAIA